MAKDSRIIPFKNYIYLLLVILFSIAILYYLYLWFVEYNKEQQKNPIMNNVMQVINSNELDTYLVENKNAIVYVSVLNNSKIRKYEKKLEKLINDENIANNLLYMDVTDNVNKSNEYTINNSKFDIPAFLVYENSQLIDIHEINEDDFNIEKTKDFLIQEEVINND